MRIFVSTLLAFGLSACQLTLPSGNSAPVAIAPTQSMFAVNFQSVVTRVEPIAERLCRARTNGVNCNFKIIVDAKPGQPANAYQTVDAAGRPILAFTTRLIAKAQNDDELAFVMGHEAAHHISGHLGRTRDSAVAGALFGGLLASLVGADAAALDTAQRVGATVGARTFSKDFELEADRLGTVIAFRSGYNPVRGAQFFTRIPDPGDQFLGTHPPNNARIATVRQTMKGLK